MPSKNIAAVIEAYATAPERRRRAREPKNRALPVYADTDDMLASNSATATLQDLVGLRVGIVYLDSRGQESRREITVRAIARRETGLALQSYCHARQAPRSFLLDGVIAVYDIDTGELLGDGAAFAETYAPVQRSADFATAAFSQAKRVAAAIDAVRNELHVLIFLARCDGWHQSELAVACNIVLDQTPDLDIAELERQVRRLDPDTQTFRAALARFERAGAAAKNRLVRAVRRLVAADEALSDAEWQFIDEMAALIEAEIGDQASGIQN
jgi:hypothetical protein